MRTSLYLLLILTAACGAIFGDEVRILGRVHIEARGTAEERPAIEVPETVSVATPFMVTIVTEGGGCRRIGDTEVDITASTATITPYDYSTSSADGGGDDLCLAFLELYEHSAQVTFDTPGASTVAVRSRASTLDSTPIEYAYPVWVE